MNEQTNLDMNIKRVELVENFLSRLNLKNIIYSIGSKLYIHEIILDSFLNAIFLGSF